MRKITLLFSLFFSVQNFAQSLVENQFPKYIQGVGSGNAADERKVPFACRMTINGLMPSTTYRAYNRFVTDPTLSDNGQGNYIVVDPTTGVFTRVTSATFSVAGRYIEFTTSPTGSFTGWFIAEPTIATTHYAPGTQLYFRLLINNGAGGTSVATRVTYPTPISVLGFGAGATQATGLRSTATSGYAAKNFVMLYTSTDGSGRPETGTFVESDGTDNTVASGYAPFYGNNVDGVANTWGTIIPNNLATGINNIRQYALADGGLISSCAGTSGVFGGVTTVNASGGLTEIALSCTPTVLPITLLDFNGSINAANKVNLAWQTATEYNFSKFVVEFAADGNRFAEVGTVKAKGSNSQYTFADQLQVSKGYYRLRLEDIDGRFTYSKTVVVNAASSAFQISVYPNPVENMLLVKHAKSIAGATLQVVNANGQKVLTSIIQENSLQSQVKVSQLANGIYVLVYTNGNETQTIRFQKK
jgi:hypothetical protein